MYSINLGYIAYYGPPNEQYYRTTMTTGDSRLHYYHHYDSAVSGKSSPTTPLVALVEELEKLKAKRDP